MKDDIKSLKAAESGGDGVLGVIIVAIALSLLLAFFVASPGGDKPGHSTPVTTATASRQQAQRPASQPETAVIVATVTIQSGSTRPASRPSQGDSTPLPTMVVPTWTPQPTYTPYPTSTPVPTAVPSQTPLPTYTAVATYTPLATYTAVPTATRPPLMAAMPVVTPAPSSGNGDTWLIAGMVICAVLVAVLLIGILVSYFSQRPIVVNMPSLPPAPHRRVLPPPIGQPIRAVAPVPPVPSTSATSANTPVAPVPATAGGKMSLTVVPDDTEFNQAEVERLCALYWQLPEGGRTQNGLIAAMWGRNEKGEPKKGPGRNAVVQYVIRLCQEEARQRRLDEMTIRSGGRTIPVTDRIRNQPPQPQKRPFPQPVKGVEG
jgi:hypothetical protein